MSDEQVRVCIKHAKECPHAIWGDWPTGCARRVVSFGYGAPERTVGDPSRCPYSEGSRVKATLTAHITAQAEEIERLNGLLVGYGGVRQENDILRSERDRYKAMAEWLAEGADEHGLSVQGLGPDATVEDILKAAEEATL